VIPRIFVLHSYVIEMLNPPVGLLLRRSFLTCRPIFGRGAIPPPLSGFAAIPFLPCGIVHRNFREMATRYRILMLMSSSDLSNRQRSTAVLLKRQTHA
jgi:hypothetical protein